MAQKQPTKMPIKALPSELDSLRPAEERKKQQGTYDYVNVYTT